MFNFFKQQNKNGASVEALNGSHASSASSLPEIEERVFTEPAASSNNFTEQPPATVQQDHTIGLLYAFLDRNHEAKGYDDALLNPDNSHLTQNIETLKNELTRTIHKVKTFYEDFILETEFHILSRARSGMIDMVEELEMKKKIALGHITKVREIEDETLQNQGDCQGILMTYTRGFKNGLAAISHHQILTRKF